MQQIDFALGRSSGKRLNIHPMHSFGHILLLHAFYELFLSDHLNTGLVRCLTTFRLSLHYKIVIFDSLVTKTSCRDHGTEYLP